MRNVEHNTAQYNPESKMRAESTQSCKTGMLHITKVNEKTTSPYLHLLYFLLSHCRVLLLLQIP